MQSSYTSISLDENSAASRSTALRTGRTMGILLLLQLGAALTLPFILTESLSVGSPAFLTAVIGNSFQVRAAVLLSFFGSALTLSLGLTAHRILISYDSTVALSFVVVCCISCMLDLVHAAAIMSMLSMSERFVSETESSMTLYTLADAVYAARRSAHIIQLLGIAAWMSVFYFSLFRFNLIPRAFSFVAMLGVASQFIGVTLMMLLGYPVLSEMAMPLLPIEIGVGLWLIVKGFKSRP